MLKISSLNELPFRQSKIDELRNFIDIIKKQLYIDDELYLFGSYAKGLIKDSSDIDILVLVNNENLDKKQIYKYKLKLYSNICENTDVEFDLKVYSKKQFMDCVKNKSFFEYEINKYMINITNAG